MNVRSISFYWSQPVLQPLDPQRVEFCWCCYLYWYQLPSLVSIAIVYMYTIPFTVVFNTRHKTTQGLLYRLFIMADSWYTWSFAVSIFSRIIWNLPEFQRISPVFQKFPGCSTDKVKVPYYLLSHIPSPSRKITNRAGSMHRTLLKSGVCHRK